MIIFWSGKLWPLPEQTAKIVQSTIAALAIIVGGLWACFKFVRFRTLKPRLEFSFDCSHSSDGKTGQIAILTLRLSNKGSTKVDLRKDGNPRCFLFYGLISAASTGDSLSVVNLPTRMLSPLGNVFVAHKWIEPGETINDITILHIQEKSVIAVQFELQVYGIQKWSASAAFPLALPQGHNGMKSEDEQDDYDE